MRHDRIDPSSSATPPVAGFAHPGSTARMFRDRFEAGQILADSLRSLLSPPAVVAAVPRGGVAVALPIAARLGFPLTVVYARKLTVPVAPELAFGALDEDGEAILDAETLAVLGLSPGEVDRAKARVAAQVKGRMALYAPVEGPSRSGLRISFKSSRDHRLAGELLVPEGAGPHPAVIFAHGRGSSKASPRDRVVAEALCAAGLAAFLFDFTGHGDSEGSEEGSTLTQQTDDLRAALDVLARLDEIDARRLGVAGARSGAAAALRLAAIDPRIRVLALCSAHLTGAESAAARVHVPTLLMVGEQDAAIRAANEELLPRLAGPRRLEVLPGANHLFEPSGAMARAVTLVVGWMKDHLK